MNIEEIKENIINFMKTKEYNYDMDDPFDNSINFYFVHKNGNPIGITVGIDNIGYNPYDTNHNEFPELSSEATIWFESTTDVSILLDHIADNKVETTPFSAFSNTLVNDLEKSFDKIEKAHLIDLVPEICEWFINEFDTYDKFKMNNTYFTSQPEKLIAMFTSCDMTEELADWALKMGANHLLPEELRELFIF